MTMIAVPTKGSNKLYDILYLEENGTNFAFWKFRIELVLQIHNLWPLINGMDKAQLPPHLTTLTGQAETTRHVRK